MQVRKPKPHLFAALSPEKIERILADYSNTSITIRDIIARHEIGKETMFALIRSHGVQMRGRQRNSWTRPPRGAFKPGRGVPDSDALVENAKLKLRRRGVIVYGAEVTNGAKSRGLFKLDHRLVTRDELLDAARRVQ